MLLKVLLEGRLAALMEKGVESQPEAPYCKMTLILRETAEKGISYQNYRNIPGVPEQIVKLCETRREAQIKLLENPSNMKHFERKKTKPVLARKATYEKQ